MSEYTSSIIIKFGDLDNARRDAKTIREIISRQGITLIIDCLADHIGEVANKYDLSGQERCNLLNKTLNELNEALTERL